VVRWDEGDKIDASNRGIVVMLLRHLIMRMKRLMGDSLKIVSGEILGL
jgi:hypothetical protein